MAIQSPIYLHASWRASSTYVWAKFRADPRAYCYFEPLDERLADVKPDAIERFSPWSYAHHPKLDAPYHHEFVALVQPGGGVRGFPADWVYGRYRAGRGDVIPALSDYFAALCAFAEVRGRVPVFGLVRSSLRAAWFQSRCPGLHIHIIRDCRRQFLSCLAQANQGSTYFLQRAMVILGHNADDPVFAPLCREIALPTYGGPDAGRAAFYIEQARRAPLMIHYALFYFLHRLAAVSRRDASDCVIDVDLLACSPGEIDRVERWILAATGFALDLGDCRPPSHDDGLALFGAMFDDVERQVDLILDQVTPFL